MQQDQFFEQQKIGSAGNQQQSGASTSHNLAYKVAQPTIDYDNFSFQEYFERSADLQCQNSQNNSEPQPTPKKESPGVTQGIQPLFQSNLTMREGFLERQCEGLLAGWEKRYWVLTQKQLFCYQNELKQNLLSCINIRLLPCSASQDYQLISIYYCLKSRPIVLRAQTTNQALGWTHSLKQVIQRHLCGKKIYLKKGYSCIYSEQNVISEQEFLREAQSGDILLMKTKESPSCSLQRLVTNSEYDHVSLIIRFDNADLQIFESNANEGVSLYGWQQFHSKFAIYERIAYRKLMLGEREHKLILEEREQLQGALVNFAKATLGREYDIGAVKLIKQWSSQDKAARSYFCSELVAKAYKLMGLIEKEKASARYWPVDFTERGGLRLLRGAALGRHKTIILQQHIGRYE